MALCSNDTNVYDDDDDTLSMLNALSYCEMTSSRLDNDTTIPTMSENSSILYAMPDGIPNNTIHTKAMKDITNTESNSDKDKDIYATLPKPKAKQTSTNFKSLFEKFGQFSIDMSQDGLIQISKLKEHIIKLQNIKGISTLPKDKTAQIAARKKALGNLKHGKCMILVYYWFSSNKVKPKIFQNRKRTFQRKTVRISQTRSIEWHHWFTMQKQREYGEQK
jgi:hypothetical protein